MPPLFIGCAAGNFQAGRPPGITPGALVLHRSGGSRSDLRVRFNDPRSVMSVHYVVARDGAIDQYVLETDTAFHAGVVVNPVWRLLRPRVNPNFYTLGIELEGAAGDGWPDAQLAAASALIAELSQRWPIPADAEHVIPHTAIRASSRCPAESCPIDRIIAGALDITPHTRVPRQPLVRTLARVNVRQGAPNLQAPILRVLSPGTEVPVSAFTDAGERVNGNPFWYGDAEEGFFWAGGTDVPHPTDDRAAPGETITPPRTSDEMEPVTPPVTPPAADTGGGPVIDRRTFVLAAKEFFSEIAAKDLVVLHFTAGTTARSAFETWRNDPQHIGTSYIVDVDGTIFEVFPPAFWAAHLGVKGTRNMHDRRSIGIEIANVGPLQRSSEDPSVLNWWPRKSKQHPEFTTKFCTLDETNRYVPANYRGKAHFASFPDVQVDAVASLVRHLCDRFSIPAAIPPLARRFECDLNTFVGYKGVCTHANFRLDKWDIGPGFPWDRLGL